jgi:hypothetical protein
MIAHWKGIIEEINFWGSIIPFIIIENTYPKKPSLRPLKWLRKLKTAKNSKLPKLPKNDFEPVGKGGWPPISNLIIEPHQGHALKKMIKINLALIPLIRIIFDTK